MSRCLAAGLVLLAAAAPVPRGTPGTLIVRNDSGAALECHAVAGHWYGFDMGDVASGHRLTLNVFYDRASGMVAWQNDRGRLVPLQYVYCGQAGDAWRTRAFVPLRDPLQRGRPVTCRDSAAGLRCGD